MSPRADLRHRGVMITRTWHPSWLAAALLSLSGCSDAGLKKDDMGRVTYDRAQPVTTDASSTIGRFSREDGCIIFIRNDGQRFLPILPEGAVYLVEPMRVLFQHDWAITGLDVSSSLVRSLRDDPVAVECGAIPAFITGFAPPGPPPPPPPPFLDSTSQK